MANRKPKKGPNELKWEMEFLSISDRPKSQTFLVAGVLKKSVKEESETK